jgi:hypothetical protein
MIYFGSTEFDPLEGSAQSIDPLRSLGQAGALADLIFPGSSGRVWRVRYLPALCFLLKHTQLDKEKDYRTNYLRFRKLENAFILCMYTLKQKFPEQYDFASIIGMSKAAELIRSNPSRIDIMGDVLSNQMNLGPLGQHTVLMRALELIEPSEKDLVLYPKGELLAERFEKAAGDDAKVFLDAVESNKVKNLRLDLVTSLSDKMLFEYRRKDQEAEKELLIELLFKDEIRKQLFRDVFSLVKKSGLEEVELIERLPELKSPLGKRYALVRAFDQFQRLLHYYFTSLTLVTKQDFRYDLNKSKRMDEAYAEVKSKLDKSAGLLTDAVDAYFDESAEENGNIAEIRDHALGVRQALSTQVDFSSFLIQFHQNHQKAKGKAPWISLQGAGKVEVEPINAYTKALPGLKGYLGSRIHTYRYSNCQRMINDLSLQEVA